MKKTKLLLSGILLLLIAFNNSYGQINNIGQFLAGGIDDGSKLMQAYIKPFTNAYGYNMTAGWYNTAKVHSLLGFDLTFTFDVAIVPTADKTFELSSLNLSSNSNGTAPTIAGQNTPGPIVTYNSGPKTVSYNTPNGINLGYWPAPMVQLGIGLIKGTEIIGRYLPELKLGSEGSIGLWGIGLKHSIKQWIPAIDHIPFLNVAVMVGYSQLHTVDNISVTPNSIGVIDSTGNNAFQNQKLDLTIKSLTANAIASVDIPILTVYLGLGFSSTSAVLKTLGNYPIPNINHFNGSNIYITDQDIVSEPINKTMKAGIKARLNGGIKIKMGVITLHFDYTKADYSIVTAGLGVSFR